MKKLIFLLIAGYPLLSATAQTKVKNYTTDRDLSRWVIDLNLMGGGYNQQMDMANTAPNYLNGINVNTGTAEFKNGKALGGNLQLGVFFGKAKHWGLGTGILFLRESGDMSLKDFHAEYQSVDNNGNIFRQVVSANSITENIKSDNYNIPLLLKYKNRLSKHWGFTADAGALFNVKMKNAYTTNASFDYEAIYKFNANSEGGNTSVYETSVIPATSDFLITQSHFTKNNPQGSVQDYFNAKRSEGYNVGLGVSPNQKTGTSNYAKGSVGFLFQPSINYFFSDHVALNVGGYYLFQPFKNDGNSTYTLTGKPGEYNPVINSVASVQTQSFGGNIGVRFFLGKKSTPLTISSADQNSPSICGLCDGNIAFHGLEAGKPARVQYKMNGAGTAVVYSGVVNASGTMVVPDLCAGSYTDIRAMIGNRSANSAAITLVDPALSITSESTDPTAQGACDASITLHGLSAGQKAKITYALNGKPQAAFDATVSAEKTIIMSGLCEGSYSDITVTSGHCTGLAGPSSFALAAPKLVTPEVVTETPKEPVVTDDLHAILFDFNTSDIKPISYSLIDEAYSSLKQDKQLYLVIDGNTDAIGSVSYNQALSERRGMAVKSYLVRKGISKNRIKISASGENNPVASNKTNEGRRQNRRAEMRLKIKN